MSSLAAARADGFYHPPGWDPSKVSRDKFQKSKGSNQYEQHGIIRFELPFDGWCEGCGRHVGKGTRFNAKKEHDGAYFSTKIWKFTMKCATCPQKFVIATDPKNTDYAFRSGLRKKVEEFEVSGEDGVDQRVQDHLDQVYHVGGHAAEQERHDRATNPMYKMQQAQDDKRRVATRQEQIEQLVELNASRRRYDYDANAVLRRAMRKRRRDEQQLDAERKALRLEVPLLPADPADAAEAHAAMREAHATAPRHVRNRPFKMNERKRLLQVATSSIFGKSSVAHQRDLAPAVLAHTVPALGQAATRHKAQLRQSAGTAPPATAGLAATSAATTGGEPPLLKRKNRKGKPSKSTKPGSALAAIADAY